MVFLKIVLVLTHVAFLTIALEGCDNSKKKGKFPDTPMYKLSSPKVLDLPEELDEISGIVYYPKDTSVFAIIDEDGILYKISLNNPARVRTWQFDKKRDFEDITLIDSTFYVLVSNGDVESIRFQGNSLITSKSNFSGESKKVNEFEAMYPEKDSSVLVILCKSCEQDPKKSFSSFSYHYTDSAETYTPYISFDMTELESKLNVDKRLKASAAAINPVTGELYIISSIQKLLVITSASGQFKEVYKLDPSIYKQPEGIAFTPAGDMIISNESAGTGFGNLLLFKNKMKGR